MSRTVAENNLREFKLAFCQAYCGKKLIEACDNADCMNKSLTVDTAGNFKIKDMLDVSEWQKRRRK